VYSRAFGACGKAVAGILPAYGTTAGTADPHARGLAVARTIGRALRLNEDLTEAVSLGHDLGQPPFGPAGEQGLDDLLSGRLDAASGPGLGDLGGFQRSWQGLRVVDLLEKRYERPGLNLTDDVREGILKAGGAAERAPADLEGVRRDRPPILEVQVVRLADRIASALHDLDDALQAGTVDVTRVETLRIVARLREARPRLPAKASRFMKANAVHRGLTHLLVTGAILSSEKAIQRWASRIGIDSAAAFDRSRSCGDGSRGRLRLPRRSPPRPRGFLAGRSIEGSRRIAWRARVAARCSGLFAAYHADPTLLEDHVLLRYREVAGIRFLRDLPRAASAAEVSGRYRRDPRFARVLADHVAAMTDAYALAEHARLLEMGAVPNPGDDRAWRVER
jgi:dGTPase